MMLDLPQGFWYDTIDSTQEEAKRLIQAGRIRGTAFVIADHQSAGKGTHGRNWVSPERMGIYLSVIHMAPENTFFEATPLYTLAAGNACVESIQTITGLQIGIKPINDLYANGKKLGGILVESDLQQVGISSLITGIGLNTHRCERNLDGSAVLPISLEELLPSEHFRAAFSKEAFVETLVAKICFWYSLLFQGQQSQVRRAWERYRLPGEAGPDSIR